MRIDPIQIKQQIDQLLLVYPEIAEDEVLRADMLEGSTEFDDFLRQIERQRQEAAAFSQAISDNIITLGERKARYGRREEAMRELEFKLLQWADLKKKELPEATLSVRNGIRKVIITEETELPDSCIRVTRAPNKTIIKEKLYAGETVPGAFLSNAEPSLQVTVK